MADKIKKGGRGALAVGLAALVLAAALLLMWLMFVFVGGKLISRSATEVELQGRGIEKTDGLLRLKDPDIIDLRGNEISPEAFEALAAAFPGCRILWDVPVAGERYDSSSVTLCPVDFEMTDSENWTYFPALTELDLREAEISAADYESLRSLMPGCHIAWTVPMGELFKADSAEETVSLANSGQLEALLSAADYLENLREIKVEFTNINLEQYEALSAAFPGLEPDYSIEIAGNVVPHNVEKLDLSKMESGDLEEVIELVKLLPNASEAELMNSSGESSLSLDDVLRLQEGCPGLKLHYSFELFGMTLSTDMERIEYFSANIGDKGLNEFRKILPLMHSLSYLRLDDCGTTDEEMARFRDENPEIKIVWRVFLAGFSCPTDTLKIWATYTLTNRTAAPLKYCTDVKYMDLGHNEDLSDFSFLEYMPDLEAAILAITDMNDLEPIRNCKKLNFLEIFSTKITDLSPLADLENLEYLNISNLRINDITPIFGLKKLKQVNCLMSKIPADQVAQFKELFPDTYSVFLSGGDPTEFNWRYNEDGSKTPRYALLTKQMGYDTNDLSVYPRGYVTEEITLD